MNKEDYIYKIICGKCNTIRYSNEAPNGTFRELFINGLFKVSKCKCGHCGGIVEINNMKIWKKK